MTAVREGAGITIASEDLSEPVTLRRLSEALMRRIHEATASSSALICR